ncbi:MAG: hypothetical protein AB7S91_25765 [Pseudonocardia sp.]
MTGFAVVLDGGAVAVAVVVVVAGTVVDGTVVAATGCSAEDGAAGGTRCGNVDGSAPARAHPASTTAPVSNANITRNVRIPHPLSRPPDAG